MKRDGFRRYAMNSLLRRNLVIAGSLCLIVIVLIVGVLRAKHASGAGTEAPPDVMVAQVEQKDVPIYGEWIGTLDGFENADVRAQVTVTWSGKTTKRARWSIRVNSSSRLIRGPFRRLSTKPKDS